MAEKIIDKDRFWYNPETGDKKFSHYTDGTPIKVDDAFAEECKKACRRQALKEIESNPKAKSKPLAKREGKRGDGGLELVRKEESKPKPKEEPSKDKK